MMNVFFILGAVLAISLNQVFAANEFSCASTIASCSASNPGVVTATTCSAKKPYFDCLVSGDCSTSLIVYKSQVTLYSYAACGASAIIMAWGLPVLMFTVAKYFSR